MHERHGDTCILEFETPLLQSWKDVLESNERTIEKQRFCFCHFFNMAIFFGVKPTRPILSLYSKCKREPSRKSHIKAILHILFLSFKIKIKLLRSSAIFKVKLITFVFATTKKASVCCHNFFTSDLSMHHYETRQSVRGNV